jgi:myo-inositol-1(or 4)-monophosphatase
MDKLLSQIEDLVRETGQILLNAKKEEKGVEEKEGRGNYVTKYDRLVENRLREELKKILPDSHFVGEEEDIHESILNHGYTFVVDPIDGTWNFAHNMDLSSISVGLLKDGEGYIGVCYDPYRNEMFTAQKDQGAYMNGKAIHVSSLHLNNGVFCSGSAPYYQDKREETIRVHAQLFRNANDYRRSGSAVIDICDVACGRLELFFEALLQPWDYCAGSIIVKEAGGVAQTLEGKELLFDRPCSVFIHNGMDDYLKYLR